MNFSLKCKNKFWFENIPELLCKIEIIPSNKMGLNNKYNSITRFVIIIFIFILIFGNITKSFIFLIISLLFIIILYYLQKTTMNQKESYQHDYKPNQYKSDKSATITYMNTLTTNYLKKNNTQTLKNVDMLQEPGSTYISYNQKLAGKAHPKTLIKPIIADRANDLDCWRKNNLVNHSHINSASYQDEYLSGYKISNCDNYPTIKDTPNNTPQQFINNIEYPYNIQNNSTHTDTGTYNYNQLSDHNLPSNLPVGNYELNPDFNEHNKNLFTQNIQPNIFTYNELIELEPKHFGLTALIKNAGEKIKAISEKVSEPIPDIEGKYQEYSQ
jgi:Ca2+/Na+ antiporter